MNADPNDRSANVACDDVRRWLRHVVVGLGLCPFARGPMQRDRIRVIASEARDMQALLHDLHAQLELLDSVSPDEIETTLLVMPHTPADFDSFLELVDVAEALLSTSGFEGQFQLATFHPRYRFENTEPDDRENFTNRAPWPVLHILREASVAEALSGMERPAAIYEANVRRLNAMTQSEMRALFAYLDRR